MCGLLCVWYADEAVVGSAFLCLATLCTALGDAVLPQLPRFMPPIVAVLESVTTAASGDAVPWSDDRTLVIHSALASVTVIADVIPRLLSPYLAR
jgi:hypothetical protein